MHIELNPPVCLATESFINSRAPSARARVLLLQIYMNEINKVSLLAANLDSNQALISTVRLF